MTPESLSLIRELEAERNAIGQAFCREYMRANRLQGQLIDTATALEAAKARISEMEVELEVVKSDG